METKHTSGHWWIDRNNEILSDPIGSIKIGKIYPISESNRGEANAKLIVVAPELLHELIDCVEYLKSLGTNPENPYLVSAELIIKKATE